jgi:hypothetical protein
MVRRKIRLSETLTIDGARRILERLRAMEGVKEVSGGEKLDIRVTYDLQCTDFAALLAALKEEGVTPSPSRWFRLKAAWFQYLDETGRENANLPTPRCCNQPPDMGTPRRRK